MSLVISGGRLRLIPKSVAAKVTARTAVPKAKSRAVSALPAQ